VSQSPAPASTPAYTHTRSASKIQAVGIVVLARNQADAISKCIARIFAANSHCGWRNSLWIVVVADSCTDDTAKAARNALGAFGQVLEIGADSRQAAYQLGAAIVMEHFPEVPRHTLLLTSTDAAAELPRDWIDTQLRSSQSPKGLGSIQA
jgi:hypothetical protein